MLRFYVQWQQQVSNVKYGTFSQNRAILYMQMDRELHGHLSSDSNL
jgi:hypothetical protein